MGWVGTDSPSPTRPTGRSREGHDSKIVGDILGPQSLRSDYYFTIIPDCKHLR